MENQLKAKLKEKHVSHIGASPILFTAPHSKTLKRGSHDVHKKQTYTNLIATDLAVHTGKNSFLFWGYADQINQHDLDPNYLKKEHFHLSPFHQALHAWALKNQGKPLFHVDIHGKVDRPHNCEIQIGIKSIEVHWHQDPLISNIRSFFKNHEHIFKGIKFGKFECEFNTVSGFSGYWGSGVHTMTQQAILLGIPSIQVQIPFQVRKKFVHDKQLRIKFHKMFKDLYQKVIVPNYSKNPRKRSIQKDIGAKFKANIHLQAIEQLSDELFNRQTSSSAD